ncbi:MAG: hypothetical protein ACR2KX_19005 [Chitinophagaceae bacterium]
MNKFLLIMGLLLGHTCCAQFSRDHPIGHEGLAEYFHILDGTGKPIPVGDFSDVNGSPLLQDKWTVGVISFADGKKYVDSFMNYSLYDDKLFIKKNNQTYPVNVRPKEFLITDGNNSGIAYQFERGFPAGDHNDSLTFYEILFAGNSFKLLKWGHKKVTETSNYGGVNQKEYSLINVYFVFLPKSNRMVEMGMKVNLNDLRKNFPEYEKDIDLYLSSHKLNTKKNEDLIQLFSFLDLVKQ